MRAFILLAGSGDIGHRLTGLLCAAGADVTVVDRVAPRLGQHPQVTWLPCDLLSDRLELPPGRVVVLLGGGHTPRWPWRAALDIAVPTARMLPALADRDVVLPLWPGGVDARRNGDVDLRDWCERTATLAATPCEPATVAALCRELAGQDPAVAMERARAAQHTLLEAAVAPLGNLTTVAQPQQQAGDPRADQATAEAWARQLAAVLLASAARPLLARVQEAAVAPPGSGTSGQPLFHPPLPVIIPPRPAAPDVVAKRQQEAMWTGRLKAGNAWGLRCEQELREHLQLDPAYDLLLTASGTAALELAIVAAAGPATPGAVALVPSFTFRATVDVLIRLGYEPRYVDVNAFSWTLDATALSTALDDDRVRLVVCVDTFGNPCAYEALGPLCAARGIPLVADSAASFGSRYRGQPVGQQAAAHSFSMSFAKALTAAGAGGAVTFRRDRVKADLSIWTGSQLMNEMHAIAALDQLPVLERMVAIRNEVAAAYASVLQGVAGVATQQVAPGDVHSYVHWVARVPDRDALAERLAELGVLTKPYFPAQHRHHPSATGAARLPVTEQLDLQALAFPTSSELSAYQVKRLQQALQIALDELAAADTPDGEEAKDA